MKAIKPQKIGPSPASHDAQWRSSGRTYALEGLKTGLAGVLALLAAETLRLRNPQWSLFTVMVLMTVHYPGSIAFKALLRFIGTLVGATLGVWLVSDYLSAPVFFLSATFVAVCFATYKLGQLGLTMTPYQYFLAGFTIIAVESAALTQPDRAWSVALSRTEEVLVGMVAVLLITPLFGARRPQSEFQRIARSAVDQLTTLTNTGLQNLLDGTGSSAEVRRELTAVTRPLLSLGGLLAAARRESPCFSANTALLDKTQASLQSLFQAVLELNEPPLDCKALSQPLQRQFQALQDAFNQGSRGDPSVLARAFQAADAKVSRWLGSGDLEGLPAHQRSAFLRRWDALRRIQEELLKLCRLETQSAHPPQAPVRPAEPNRGPRKVNRRLLIIGINGGLATVLSLFLVVWLHLPGAGTIPTAAWTSVLVSSYELPFGRPGHLRSFNHLLTTALYGMLIVLATLVLAPFMSNYWFMNLILFCTLFAYGYFASKTAGTTFWMLGTLLFVSAVVALNAQEPVPFVAIINSYLGVMIGLTIGVTLSRVLWPALPQKALREAITRFCQVAAAVLDEKSEGSMAGLKSTLAALPLEIARTTAALGVNPLLRQEQAKWNALVPLLMSLSAQLPRLASVRTHLEGSQELKRYLCGLHQEFGAWLEGLGHFFRRPDRKKALPPLRGIIERLQQKMEGPNPAEGLHPSSRGLSPKTLMEVGEYLVAAELLQRCGEMASDLQLAEYWGDYFL